MENSAIHDSQNHQKVKKKAKNKKHPQASVVVQNNGNAADSAVTEIATKNCKPPSTLDNCLSEKLQESLHISTKKSKSNRCNNKINGIVGILVTENGADEATATTKTTTAKTDINGHSVESQINYSISAMNGCATSIEDLDNDQRPNGHCSDATINLTSKNISSNNCHSDESICETSLSEQSSNEKTNSFSNKFSATKTFQNIVSADPVQDSMPSTVESLPLTQLPSPATTICGVEAAAIKLPQSDLSKVHIEYKQYESELQMHDIMRLIQAELSEPYSIYTYRYFIYNWPKLCFLAAHGNVYVGAIVCKLDMHQQVRRGYIAMLAVHKDYRNLKIGTTLVQKAIEAMLADNAEEVVLETEMQNMPALRLYENLGFVRDKRLFRYYLNGVDALRLKLWFR